MFSQYIKIPFDKCRRYNITISILDGYLTFSEKKNDIRKTLPLHFQLVMDCGLCIICQNSTGENLQYPANSQRKDACARYTSFVRNLQEFQKLGSTPASLNIDCLDEGQGIEQTLLDNKASWHKCCRDIFGNTKLVCAKKRKLAEKQTKKRQEKIKEQWRKILPVPLRPGDLVPQAVFQITAVSFVIPLMTPSIFVLHLPSKCARMCRSFEG